MWSNSRKPSTEGQCNGLVPSEHSSISPSGQTPAPAPAPAEEASKQAPIPVSSQEDLNTESTITDQVLERALQRLGNRTPAESGARLRTLLEEELHIYNAQQLCEAVNTDMKDTSTSADTLIRRHLAPNLLLALQAEVKELMKSVAKYVPKSEPRRLSFEITRCDVVQLSNIDQISNSFEIEIFLQITLPGGAADAGLSAKSDEFPLDLCGRPTFRPSAEWFRKLIDFTTVVNGKPLKTVVDNVVRMGEDLQINKRVIGCFFDSFEGFRRFPFDEEALTVTLVVNCADQGATPVDVILGKTLQPSVVSQADFADRNAWMITRSLSLDLTDVGTSSTRRFPALAVTVRVRRLAFYYHINVALPSALFTVLSVVLLSLPINFPPARLTYSLALTLTVVAYKLSTSNAMPTVTYLTTVDKFQLLNALIVLFTVFETAVLGVFLNYPFDVDYSETLHLIDQVIQIFCALASSVLITWWLSITCKEERRRTKLIKDELEDRQLTVTKRDRRMSFDEATGERRFSLHAAAKQEAAQTRADVARQGRRPSTAEAALPPPGSEGPAMKQRRASINRVDSSANCQKAAPGMTQAAMAHLSPEQRAACANQAARATGQQAGASGGHTIPSGSTPESNFKGPGTSMAPAAGAKPQALIA